MKTIIIIKPNCLLSEETIDKFTHEIDSRIEEGLPIILGRSFSYEVVEAGDNILTNNIITSTDRPGVHSGE